MRAWSIAVAGVVALAALSRAPVLAQAITEPEGAAAEGVRVTVSGGAAARAAARDSFVLSSGGAGEAGSDFLVPGDESRRARGRSN